METEYCMKCGRELKPQQVFCDECRAEMEKYPVKPGVVVLLPRRGNQQVKPSGRRRSPVLSPEEQLPKLKKSIVALTAALILSITATAALGWMVLSDWLDGEEMRFLPGQNYSSTAPLKTSDPD